MHNVPKTELKLFQLPACNASEVCKDVTVKPGQYIVNPKCLCENGLACPSVTKKGVTKTL